MWKHKMCTYVIATLMSTNLPNLENPKVLYKEIYIIQSKSEIFLEIKTRRYLILEETKRPFNI